MEKNSDSELPVQTLSCVWLFATPWTAARQVSPSFTIFWSLLKLMFIESVMPSNHLILCHPFPLLPSPFPSIKVFSNESAFCIRWLKHWNFSFSISPSNEYSGLISFVCVCVSHSVVLNSLQTHGLQPTRLLCPWDFPGKDTGVGCHFLLQGIFPTHGLNPGLLHCRQILYRLSYREVLKSWRPLSI